jgi:ABC-2 type transport system ATP-binding protein
MAQALVNDPEVVFLDEPMSGLDPIGRREVRDLIASLRTEGKTVFMCSHILSDIEVLCDRVAILKGGHLSRVGYLEELRRGTSRDSRMEVVMTGTDAATFARYFGRDNQFQTIASASGLRIEIESEEQVESVLAALRKCEGKLIAVQPLRQSLEELFVDETST